MNPAKPSRMASRHAGMRMSLRPMMSSCHHHIMIRAYRQFIMLAAWFDHAIRVLRGFIAGCGSLFMIIALSR
jgi:hypothetical protein